MAPFTFPEPIESIILTYGLDRGLKDEIEAFNIDSYVLTKLRESMDNQLIVDIAVTGFRIVADWPMTRDENGAWGLVTRQSREFRLDLFLDIKRQMQQCRATVMRKFASSTYGKLYLRLQEMERRRHQLYNIILLTGVDCDQVYQTDSKLSQMVQSTRTFAALKTLETTSSAITDALLESLS